jgi:hypothetical protein
MLLSKPLRAEIIQLLLNDAEVFMFRLRSHMAVLHFTTPIWVVNQVLVMLIPWI